ncbi:MAG TPA: FAD-dependent oxidoreductase [Bryobacteraceae bacterium]|nr:FAD-dependent oxidoreductase [Bryobacteraceae bacterium]
MQVETIIVFCHLRWNFVFQRPQHIVSRLARGRRIFFIEEPQHCEGQPHWQKTYAQDGEVMVCTPCTPVTERGFSAAQMPPLRSLMAQLLREEDISKPAVWFYTPMALPLADELNPKIVVYDCMDELSAFAGAPPELIELEAQLFRKADLVFTGGRSLYEAKRARHPQVHCFPSSVDVVHFGEACIPGMEHPDQVGLPHPRLGYFGVIDERMDLEILRTLSRQHPEWQICLVGPVVKIDPATVPVGPNIHPFGQRGYDELPKFLGGWDVALLPFALNDATRFISPTKTLEYMAGEKPIVSTPIRDVVDCYSDVVRIGATPDQFVRQCEAALQESEELMDVRCQRMRQILQNTSWDLTAGKMEDLLERAAKRRTLAVQTSPRNVVIGAGPTGLSAAYHLGDDALLLEKEDKVGGWCRSLEANGFTFDYAGHIMFSNDPYVHELYQLLLGDNVHWQDREAWIYSQGVYTRYPFQGSLYGLPAHVIKDCVMGAIEARFGPLKASPRNGHANGANGTSNGHAYANGHASAAKESACTTASSRDCCADGILELETPLAPSDTAPADDFESFIYRTWGRGIAKHFAIPYNRKLWAVPLREMETSWLGGRVPLPDLEEMIEGALLPKPKPMGPNARFGYPLHGGFQSLMDGFLPRLKGEVRLNAEVMRIAPRSRRVFLQDGTPIPYRKLISTMPLPTLIARIGEEVPAHLRRASQDLRYTSVQCVHIGVGRSDITEKHWIYYPEDTVFHRIFVQGNASPHCNPPGGFGFTCEITYGPNKPLPCTGEDLIRLCIEDAKRVGFMRPDDPIWATAIVDLPCAYVVYDHRRKSVVASIREWLASMDILVAGRYGEWEYYNSDHAFIAGKKAADQVLQSQRKAHGPSDAEPMLLQAEAALESNTNAA